MACRDCQLLRVLPDADGKVRIRKNRSYHCAAKLENLRLPKSVRNFQPPYPGHMEPDEGEGCSYHVPRDLPTFRDVRGILAPVSSPPTPERGNG